MRTLYLDCGMGAAGDMLTAALLELIPDPDDFIRRMNGLGIPGVRIGRERVVKNGIAGTRIFVIAGSEEEGAEHSEASSHRGSESLHCHRSMSEIDRMIGELHISDRTRAEVTAVYRLIAEAESQVHGVPVSEIHFHEVGMLDALSDISAVCLLMERIRPDRIVVSPVHVGSGQVACAHGILPVPAPATAYLLRGVPIYGGEIRGELCTPTGAALLKHFADSFGAMPVMSPSAVGYGMGNREFERVNCVRAILGETEAQTEAESVLELSCNVDDMTAEAVGFAAERLLEAGACDVYTVSVGMKKSRPGIMICVLCRAADRERMISLLFKHTSTIGVREALMRRCVLERHTETADTPYGKVRRKVSSGYGVKREKYEYDDLARIAREREISLRDAQLLAEHGRE